MRITAGQIRSFVVRNWRVGRLSVLLGLGSSARLAVEKLILIPLLLGRLGPDALGAFLLLLGWAQVIGLPPSSGTSDALLRLQSESRKTGVWPSILASGIVVASALSLALIALASLAFSLTGGEVLHSLSLLVIGGIGLSTVLMVSRGVWVTAFRVEFQFGRMAFFEGLSAGLLLLAVPAAYWRGLTGASLGYAVSSILILLILFFVTRGLFRGQPIFHPIWTKRLISAIVPFTLTSALGLAFAQSARLAVGIFRPASEVTAFYAAEAVILLLVSPLGFVASTVYTFVARHARPEDIPRSLVFQHVLASLACALLVFIAALGLGPAILDVFYGPVAGRARPLLKILAVAGAMNVLFLLCQGFVLRFCSFRRIMAYTTLNVIILLTCLLVAIPLWGLEGAAWAVVLAKTCIAVLWFGTYLRRFLFSRSRRSAAVAEP